MTLSIRLFDLEAAVVCLSAKLADGTRPTPEDLLRLYVLREKIDDIIAGGGGEISTKDAKLYDLAHKKWRENVASN